MMSPPEPPLPQPHAEAPAPNAASAAERRAERRLEMRAALLLILMALLLLGAGAYLMWARGAFEATQRLVLLTDDAEGVVVGMDMTFAGFPIGRVRRTELGGDGRVRILVDVPLKDAHWLRQSSVYTLERGLVGAARLRAFTGVLDDDPLPPDAEREVLRGDVSAEIPKMVADARDVLQNINRITSGESDLSATLKEVQTFAARLNSAKGGMVGALTGNDADARRVSELLAHATQLIKRLDTLTARVDTTVQRADRQVLGPDGLVGNAQGAVKEMHALLTDTRQSLVRVDAVLKDAQAISGNARAASANLDTLRADVEASLGKIDALITELNRKWPFAPKEKQVQLP